MPQRPTTLYPRASISFSIGLAVVVLGLSPSWSALRTGPDPVREIHAFAAAAWMLLLVLQGWLANHRYYELHRAFAGLSLLLAPALLASGLLIIRTRFAHPLTFTKEHAARLAWVDLGMMAAFLLAYGLAIWFRRNQGLHARFMASTAVLLLAPALAQFCLHHFPRLASDRAFHFAFLLTEGLILFLIMRDLHAHRIRWPHACLLLAILIQHVGFLLVLRLLLWGNLLSRLPAIS